MDKKIKTYNVNINEANMKCTIDIVNLDQLLEAFSAIKDHNLYKELADMRKEDFKRESKKLNKLGERL